MRCSSLFMSMVHTCWNSINLAFLISSLVTNITVSLRPQKEIIPPKEGNIQKKTMRIQKQTFVWTKVPPLTEQTANHTLMIMGWPPSGHAPEHMCYVLFIKLCLCLFLFSVLSSHGIWSWARIKCLVFTLPSNLHYVSYLSIIWTETAFQVSCFHSHMPTDQRQI